MLKLLTFPPAFGLSTPTPFGLKVEAYLRFAKIPYELVPTPDPRSAPKKKLPMIVDDGASICDSAFILAHLAKKYGDTLDANLTDEQRGVGHAVRRMLEEATYFTGMYSRWMEPETWAVAKQAFFGKMPFPMRAILPSVLHQTVKKTLWAQGTGRHTRDEIYALARDDWDSVARVLDGKPWLLGDAPTSYDATVYAFLAQALFVPFDSPTKAHLQAKANLFGYANRIRAEYFAGA